MSEQKTDAVHRCTEEQLVGHIIDRLNAIAESCNSHHINHQSGVLRGLVWALTGIDPGAMDTPADIGSAIGREICERNGKFVVSN